MDATGNAYSLTGEIAQKAQLDADTVDLSRILYLKKCQEILSYLITFDLPTSLVASFDFGITSTKFNGKIGNFDISFNSITLVEIGPSK
jgi:hypothetical protein